ncbi:MAG: hypothetical protein RLZZ126_1615 [Pseudomonadota bacterium]|jgi:hypothetical protein
MNAFQSKGQDDGTAQLQRSVWSSFISLFASSSTLVCCALPALLVALGAGATLSGLVGAFPQIVWLSEHKVSVFIFAGLMLMASGALQWRGRRAPCPLDPQLRDACLRTRRASSCVFALSLLLYGVGGWFAFVWPLLV